MARNSLPIALGALVATIIVAAPIRGQQAEKDMKIRLQAATFDPLQGLPVELDRSLLVDEPATGKGRWIVQFQGPLTREQRQLLTSRYGLDLDHYVEKHAFLETVDAETMASLRELDFFRADVLYQPAFKISPTIGKVEYRTEYRRSIPGLLLRAVLFDDADLEAAADQLRALPGVSDVRTYDDRELGGVARILFQLPDASSIPDVARLDTVRWIAEVGEIIDDEPNN